MANGKDGTWVTINGAHILLGSPAHTKLLKSIQQRRQAMKDTARGMEEAESYVEAACLILHEAGCTEVTPPGFEHVVKSLKRKKGVENPWAVAWSMKNKGAEPGAKKKEAYAYAAECFEQAARLVEAVEDAEAGTSQGAKAGWERRKRGGDPAPAATPEQIGAERRAFSKRSKAARLGAPRKQKMDIGGTISPRAERQRRVAALDKHFAAKYANVGGPGSMRPPRPADPGPNKGTLHGWFKKDVGAGGIAQDIKDAVAQGRKDRGYTSEAAYLILEELDALLEAFTDEAGTSDGAKKGWASRKGGGGGKTPDHGIVAPHPGGGRHPDAPAAPRTLSMDPNDQKTKDYIAALKKHRDDRLKQQRKKRDEGYSNQWGDEPWGSLPGGQMRSKRTSEAVQPVRATLVIREAAGMSSLPQLGRAGVRVPGRPGSGLVRKDNGSVERVPVQKGSFHDDLRRKTSLRRVMHKTPHPSAKVGAA